MKNSQSSALASCEYSSENRKYNEAYLAWRRETKAAHIYRFSDPNENVYIDGDAAVPPKAEIAEKTALMRCGELIGAALLLFLLLWVVGGSVLIWVLRLFDIDIRLDFLSLQMDGSQWAVVAVKSVVLLLKYLFPLILLQRSCKIPKKLVLPFRLGALPEMIAAIGTGMIVSGIFALCSDDAGVESAQMLFTYKNTGAIVTYGLVQMFIGSLLAELFLRGGILTLLRQFGDPFAIVTVAAMSFMFPNTLEERISEFLLGLSAGYLLVRAGSLSKCVLLRVVYTGLNYARLVLVYTTHKLYLWEFSLILIALGVMLMALYSRLRRDKLRLQNRKTLLSVYDKLSALVLSVTMLPWIAASFLLMLMQLFY